MYKSGVTLTQDEEFSGTVTMFNTYLNFNGYKFRLSGGGNLEQWDGLVNLDHGTLYVDGDYILHCNSILQMIQEDDLLQEALAIAILMGSVKFFFGIIIQSMCKYRQKSVTSTRYVFSEYRVYSYFLV